MFNSTLRLSYIAALTTLAVYIQPVAAQSDGALPPGTVASINGRPVTQIAVDNVARQISESGEQADTTSILEELINLEVLTQAAEELDLDKDEEIAAALQLQYIQTMANAYLARKSSEISITDGALQAEYEAQSNNAELAEYRANHILLESAADAQKVLIEISDGKTFSDAAKEHSIDSGGRRGGDLGWFTGSSMEPEFAGAIATMEIGSISSKPVKTDYGYHIINLVEKRNAALPSFDSVKTGLTNLVLRKTLARHVEELKAEADINRQ